MNWERKMGDKKNWYSPKQRCRHRSSSQCSSPPPSNVEDLDDRRSFGWPGLTTSILGVFGSRRPNRIPEKRKREQEQKQATTLVRRCWKQKRSGQRAGCSDGDALFWRQRKLARFKNEKIFQHFSALIFHYSKTKVKLKNSILKNAFLMLLKRKKVKQTNKNSNNRKLWVVEWIGVFVDRRKKKSWWW